METHPQQPVAVCLVKNAEGLVRCDMPDGTTQYVTEEDYWNRVRPLQVAHAERKKREANRQAARALLEQMDAEDAAAGNS